MCLWEGQAKIKCLFLLRSKEKSLSQTVESAYFTVEETISSARAGSLTYVHWTRILSGLGKLSLPRGYLVWLRRNESSVIEDLVINQS